MLTVERVRELVKYDPETGEFSGRKAQTTTRGYRQICIDNKRYLTHRLAWFYVFGEWPRQQIDHIDQDKKNDRIGNLRDTSQSINQQNRRKPLRNNKTGFLGVTKDHNRFKSTIYMVGKSIHLGQYATAEEAHLAYMIAKRIVHALA